MTHGDCRKCEYYVKWVGCMGGVPFPHRYLNNDGYWTCEQFKEENNNGK